jgi:hypothetical protein
MADRDSRGHVHTAEGVQCQPDGGMAARAITLDAYGQASAAVLRIARETGVPIGSRQIWPDSATTVHYAEPAAGLRIARALEHAAVRVVRDYIRDARVAGLWWHEIGGALGLGPDAKEGGQALGEAAFGYAAGESSLSWRASFGWTCPACGQSVTDRARTSRTRRTTRAATWTGASAWPSALPPAAPGGTRRAEAAISLPARPGSQAPRRRCRSRSDPQQAGLQQAAAGVGPRR